MTSIPPSFLTPLSHFLTPYKEKQKSGISSSEILKVSCISGCSMVPLDAMNIFQKALNVILPQDAKAVIMKLIMLFRSEM